MAQVVTTYAPNAVANLLNERAVMDYVVRDTGDYNMLHIMFNKILGKQNYSFGVKNLDANGMSKLELPYLGNLVVNATIASRTVSGLNLDITFNNPQYNSFLKNDQVQDGTFQGQGTVISSTAGAVTIAPAGASQSGFVAANFPVGGTISKTFNTSANLNSSSQGSIYYLPELRYNVFSNTRKDQDMSRREFEMSLYGTDLTKPWSLAQQKLCLSEFTREDEMRKLLSYREDYNASTAGSTYGGVKWWIDMFGTPTVSDLIDANLNTTTNVSNIELLLQNQIRLMRQKHLGSIKEIFVLCGDYFLGVVQSGLGTKYIAYAGDTNTMSVMKGQGIDLYSYQFMGTRLVFVPYGALNDPQLFGAQSTLYPCTIGSASAYFLTTDAARTIEGTKPAWQEYLFGREGGAEMFHWFTAGTINVLGDPASYMRAGGFDATGSPIDKVSYGFLKDSTIVCNNPTAQGYIIPLS